MHTAHPLTRTWVVSRVKPVVEDLDESVEKKPRREKNEEKTRTKEVEREEEEEKKAGPCSLAQPLQSYYF